MRTAEDIINAIYKTFAAHEAWAKTPQKRVRKWDGKTPYAVHPIWCGLMVLHESGIPEEDRYDYAEALFYHDILEDTTAGIPLGVSERVRWLVDGMTFYGGTAEEMEHVWERGKEILLLKLYDKVSNLFDASWMPEEKREKYMEYVRKLVVEVEKEYGNLNIVIIAKALCVQPTRKEVM